MKKIHIILLVLIAGTIAFLIAFISNTSTYDTVQSAVEKPGKYVHLMAAWDKSAPLEYDALKDPNFLSFTAKDTLGQTVKVVYRKPKPDNFEISEKLVLKGKYNDGVFYCDDIQTKCPSKYKEDMAAQHKAVENALDQKPE